MNDLSLTILDIACNCKAAGAKNVLIRIKCDLKQDKMTILILDDGRGMTKKQIQNAVNPFYTTRTTRKIGMGLPLFKMLSEQCEGELKITRDKKTKGLRVKATFKLSSIDRPPLGDLGSTITTLINADNSISYTFRYEKNSKKYIFSTLEVRNMLEMEQDEEFNNEILSYVKEMINENIDIINGGLII